MEVHIKNRNCNIKVITAKQNFACGNLGTVVNFARSLGRNEIPVNIVDNEVKIRR